MESQEVLAVILLYEVFFGFKFDENRLIGSKVTAVFQNIDFGWDFSILGCVGVVFRGLIPPNFRFIGSNHTKGTFLRQTAYFEVSNVKIG